MIAYIGIDSSHKLLSDLQQRLGEVILFILHIFVLTYLLLGCPMANPCRKIGRFPVFFLVFFSVSVKVLPVTPLVSGVFVHRAFCAYS